MRRDRMHAVLVASVAAGMAAFLTPAFCAGGELREHLRHRFEVQIDSGKLMAADRALYAAQPLLALYETRAWMPLWFDESGQPRPALAGVAPALEDAARHGFEPEHYHLEIMRARLAELESGAQSAPPVRELADIELLVSDALLTLAGHYSRGRIDPTTIDPGWHLGREYESLAGILEGAVLDREAPARALEALLPRHEGYPVLVERLALQRTLAANGDWDALPAGASLRLGDSDPRLPAIRRRLFRLGDHPTTPVGDEHEFDPTMDQAVRAFQARHGLEIDGVVGPRTLAQLNVSPEDRIEQLLANLERWRWLPTHLGQEYILVNIAGFHMVVVAGEETVMRQRVIVGRAYRRTPVFTGRMTYLVLNPSWEVPPRMAVVDQLPQIREDPGYLERMGFSVLEGWGAGERIVDPDTVDWHALSRARFPYRLRQMPGPENALGQVKFMFPNSHNVYLHDTPARGLFALEERAFSSGCIRIEDPVGLAEWLLAGPGRPEVMTADQIRRILDAGRETTVPLGRALPVHLLYWTAWVDDDGRIHYRRDIYDRDRALIEALRQPPPGANNARD